MNNCMHTTFEAKLAGNFEGTFVEQCTSDYFGQNLTIDSIDIFLLISS